MENVKNLKINYQYEDGAYDCILDMYDEWNHVWDTVPYIARKGDPAPINKWIIEQIDTKQFDPIPLFQEPNP